MFEVSFSSPLYSPACHEPNLTVAHEIGLRLLFLGSDQAGGELAYLPTHRHKHLPQSLFYVRFTVHAIPVISQSARHHKDV